MVLEPATFHKVDSPVSIATQDQQQSNASFNQIKEVNIPSSLKFLMSHVKNVVTASLTEDIFSKYELDKEKLLSRYEQMRKKEKAALAELEKAFTTKIASAEEALKRKKQDDKSFSFLRKSLGSFLEVASDDD